MRSAKSFLFAILLLALVPAGRAQYSPDKPLGDVTTLLVTWHDDARNRDIPVKIYYPANAKSPCPVIIFSHGLGGTRDGYSYLGNHWAGWGYISVHLQHLRSDDSVWRGVPLLQIHAALESAVANPQNALNRAEDVPFAITKVLALNNAPGPLKGLIDPNEIGMAGHSFGAWTTLAVAGEKDLGGADFTDSRIRAAIAMSAPVPGGPILAKRAFGGIAIPVFHMTGTLDNSPVGDTTAGERRIPFDQSKTPGTCLLILDGADHMTFSGHPFGLNTAQDLEFQKYILAGSIAFWDANLRGDQAAKDWLYHGGFAAYLGKVGTFETR